MLPARWVREFRGWFSDARAWAVRAPKLACADCPIVMSCGLEPQVNCLPRLEAVAAGKRREIGPHDTCCDIRFLGGTR